MPPERSDDDLEQTVEESRREDSHIEHAASFTLAWATRVPKAVRARVIDGVVRLHGVVERPHQREAAEEAVRGLIPERLLASGSEVSLCLEAYRLAEEGVPARVVSMPSWELFEQQSQDYQDSVLPPDVIARVSVEQASTFGWELYVGSTGTMLGMARLGASPRLKELQKKFGFTVEHVLEVARAQLGRRAGVAVP
jgi:Transketolase, C-terminal domain